LLVLFLDSQQQLLDSKTGCRLSISSLPNRPVIEIVRPPLLEKNYPLQPGECHNSPRIPIAS